MLAYFFALPVPFSTVRQADNLKSPLTYIAMQVVCLRDIL